MCEKCAVAICNSLRTIDKNKKMLKKVFKDTLPVLTGYIVLGFGFGFILKSNGYGVLTAFVMSLFIYAGSMQYAAVGLMSSGASLLTVAVTTLMVNIRHLFYGISMIDKYKDTGKAKPYLIFSLTDETYSLVCGDMSDIPSEKRRKYCFLVSMFNQVYWIIGSVIGAIAGNIIKFNSAGIDFALTALFITIFIEQWLSDKRYMPAVTGVAVSVICLILFGSDMFLIPSMLIISLIFYFYKEEKNR